MPIEDDLRPASFRGVPFHMLSLEGSGIGRRVAVHKYATQTPAFAEDLSEPPLTFVVEAWLIGDDYVSQLADLKRALGVPGPGRLIPPLGGPLSIQVGEGSWQEDFNRRLGYASITFPCYLATDNLQPEQQIDTGFVVDEKASVLDTTLRDEFSEKFSVKGLPDFVTGSLSDGFSRVEEFLQNHVDLSSAAGFPGFEINTADFSSPVGLVDRVQSTLRSFAADGALDRGAVANAMQDLGTDVPGFANVPLSTATRQRQQGLHELSRGLVRGVAASEFFRALARIDPETDNAATVLIERSAAFAGDLAKSASADGFDRTSTALRDLRGASIVDLTERGRRLPTLVSEVVGSMPVEVLAYRLYGDVGRADEIRRRNGTDALGWIGNHRPTEFLST